MPKTQDSISISTKLERIASLAKRRPNEALRTLSHHIDLDWLKEAYRRTRKDGAVGVDGQTAEDYAAHLDDHLRSLLERAKSGLYRAPPVRRVYIPKGRGSETRPLGIPTFEDKVLQRAVGMVLESVYEQDFLDCSYGFRPGRSTHDASDALQRQLVRLAGGFVLELDVCKFFDTMDHGHLLDLLRRRVRDGMLLRLIGKWLKAGVLEGGQLATPKSGTPQGGVISPILANIYLHEVIDLWFARDVLPRMRRRAYMFRYADDVTMVFASRDDAHRVSAVLPKRLKRFGLSLHPNKTRLVEFRRPNRGASPKDGPGTFNQLGFTFYWAKSRKGKWVVKRKTAKDRLRRSLANVSEWCRRNRHRPLREQQAVLSQKLRGHYGYFGVPANIRSLQSFYFGVQTIWRRWLGRRSDHGQPWCRMRRILERFPLPGPRITHRPAST